MFNATNRGWAGQATAAFLGDVKEEVDYLRNWLYKGMSPNVAYDDMVHDMLINEVGRQKALLGKWQTAKDACAEYRFNPRLSEDLW